MLKVSCYIQMKVKRINVNAAHRRVNFLKRYTIEKIKGKKLSCREVEITIHSEFI